MINLQKIVLVVLAVIIVIFTALVVIGIIDARNDTQDQVVAVAEDLGCTFIEQSYHHPENYYIDCGDDEIRIINLEK